MDLSQATVRQAVKTLLCLPKPGKKQRIELVPTDDRVELVIAVKKIPQMSRIHVGRIVLPHSMYNSESNICLFVKHEGGNKNREFHEIKEKYLKKLKEVGVEEVNEVIPLKQLELEFEPFEAKRRLSDAFDGYMADERIYHLLRPLLGKHFYSRHRFPISVRLTSGNLAKEVRVALQATYFTVTKRGPCTMIPVAVKTINTEDEIVENILAVWNNLDTKLPGGRQNVRSISIKTGNSRSVPLYTDLGYSTEVSIPDLRDYHEEPEPEEIDTVSGAKVMVYPDGRVRLIRKPKKTEEDDEDQSSADEDDHLIKQLIDRDEEAEARRKRRSERKASGKKPIAKKSRPLLEAHAKAEAEAVKH